MLLFVCPFAAKHVSVRLPHMCRQGACFGVNGLLWCRVSSDRLGMTLGQVGRPSATMGQVAVALCLCASDKLFFYYVSNQKALCMNKLVVIIFFTSYQLNRQIDIKSLNLFSGGSTDLFIGSFIVCVE